MAKKIAPRVPDTYPEERDTFAMAALTGISARSMTAGTEDTIARMAYMLADAMLVEKAKYVPPVEPKPVDAAPKT